jgi:hypothetical protein
LENHEGKWFSSLSRHLADVPLIRIKQRGQNPIHIEKLLRYDKPDIILVNGEQPVLVVEKTAEVPSGHNIGQRFGRIVNAAEENVMALFFLPFVAKKHGRYSGACYIPGRFFRALEKIEIIHEVPVLAIDWPSDSSFELITDGTENKVIGELVDDLIYHNFDYSKCEKIKSVRNLMLERVKPHVRKDEFGPLIKAANGENVPVPELKLSLIKAIEIMVREIPVDNTVNVLNSAKKALEDTLNAIV